MSSEIRVLHVSWEFPPVIYGGLARHVEALTRAQHAAGLGVIVVTAAEDVTTPARRIPPGRGTRRGIEVIRARRTAPRRPWTEILAAAAQLDDAMGEAGLRHAKAHPGPPSVVHAHDWIGARAGRRIADLVHAPFVLTMHATEWGRRQGRIGPQYGTPAETGPPAAIHQLERQAVRSADAIIVCSESMRAEICDVLDADPDAVTVVPNAVDAGSWRTGPGSVRAAREHWLAGAESPAGPAGPLIAAAGRLEWEKGFSTLIRALPELRAVHPGIRVVLAGRGSYTGDLEHLADELGVLESIERPGWLGRRDLAALYAAADAVVVPSRYEPSGLVAREAQAAGGTVIATRTGGLADAVEDDVTGRLIDVGDVHRLRDVILDLAADPATARRLARAGSAAVSELTWADVARATSGVYGTLAR